MTETLGAQFVTYGRVTAFMDATYTQANAAGGAIKIDIGFGTGGSEWMIMYGAINCTGTHSLTVYPNDGSNVSVLQWLSIAAVASVKGSLPQMSSNTATSTPVGASPSPFIISGTHTLSIEWGEAGAQNDTMRIRLWVRVWDMPPDTFVKSRSVNAANVSVTSGAASFAVI